jgi:hypothetical protein
MDEYPAGAYDMFVLIQFHLHVARSMSDGVVRFYNFNFFVLRFLYLCKLNLVLQLFFCTIFFII